MSSIRRLVAAKKFLQFAALFANTNTKHEKETQTMMKFLKGMMLGLIAGVCAGLSVTPRTRRQIMRSQPCHTMKRICRSIEDMF